MRVIVRYLIHERKTVECHKHRTLVFGLVRGRLARATESRDEAVVILSISCCKLT